MIYFLYHISFLINLLFFISNLAHVYVSIAVCEGVGGCAGQDVGVSREGQRTQQSHKTPASQPIRAKALVDSQWQSGLVAFDGGATISLVTEQQRWGQDGRRPALQRWRERG